MPSRRSRIDEVLEQQDADLQLLEDGEAERFLVIYEAARQELRERLDDLVVSGAAEAVRFTAQHLRVMRAQAERGIRDMERRLGRELDDAVDRARERALENLVQVIKSAEPEFRDTGSRIEHRVLRRFQRERGLLVHKYSVRRYSADVLDDIQRELSIGLVRGQNISELRDRLFAQQGSAMSGRRARAETIVRMELNHAYNQGHQSSVEEAHEVLDDEEADDPLMKRADEARDARNHPISRVLDGMVVPVDQPFRAPVVRVQEELAKLNAERAALKLAPRSSSGIVWPLEGGAYVGMYPPAHYRDRGRIVAWRRGWEST